MRVRLSRIEDIDLHHFEFDLDLTMMIFFLDAEGKIYARYGGRGPDDADAHQTLPGLRYTMESVLAMHASKTPRFAQPTSTRPLFVKDLGRRRGGCVHCHTAKEMIYSRLASQGKWTRDMAWRYPLPDRLGFVLDVDRGNLVARVVPDSPAARAGLKVGDRLETVGEVPIHSIGDVQFALDPVPAQGKLTLAWARGDERAAATLDLPEGWRRFDISWRTSQSGMVPSLHVYGEELTAAEKQKLGLAANRTAFRQQERVHSHARNAGIQPGDIILGVDAQPFELEVLDFLRHIRSHYLVGDRVQIDVIRAGRRLQVPMKLVR